MIGQERVLEWVDNNINSFPQFIVLIGSSGSGKRTLAKTISDKLSLTYAQCEISVSSVREMIDTSYKTHEKVLYCFEDADNMRPEAKNALLKITEEPPKNSYFCLTITDSSYLLDTLKSRAMVFNMQPYTREQINQYAIDKHDSNLELYSLLCDVPGEVDILSTYDTEEFFDFTELVLDNIGEVQPANAFKSSNELSLKKDSDGYDLKLFWKCFVQICLNRIERNENVAKMSKAILATEPFINRVSRIGVNKQQLYDNWVFSVREVL